MNPGTTQAESAGAAAVPAAAPAPAPAAAPAADRSRGAWAWFIASDRRVLATSLFVQLALAPWFGHSYDTRIFMAAGYLVGTGRDPYAATDLSAVFHHPFFQALTSIGYPPPWPLALGGLYRVAHALSPNLLVYNLFLKLPLIAATVALAYLVAAELRRRDVAPRVVRRAWVFMLLCPSLLYFGAAWGQIDVIVALLALASLAQLAVRHHTRSALLLSLAVCVKPTALPILAAAAVFVWVRSRRRALLYALTFLAATLVFYVGPFFVMGWSRAPFTRHAGAHFLMHGSMSYTTVIELFHEPLDLAGHWWLAGLVWIPALAIGMVAARHRRAGEGFEELVEKSVALILIVFLTRTWLSETNTVLLVPLVVILVALGDLDRRALTAVWVLPLLFAAVDGSAAQLLFPVSPTTGVDLLARGARLHDIASVARAVVVIAWQVAGWWIVVACLRRDRARGGRASVEGLASWS